MSKGVAIGNQDFYCGRKDIKIWNGRRQERTLVGRDYNQRYLHELLIPKICICMNIFVHLCMYISVYIWMHLFPSFVHIKDLEAKIP